MDMSRHQFPQTRWWLSKPTMEASGHTQYQNDIVSADYCEHRHVAPYHREPMFEKSLTPSDVGKLNRLVIPKQHAEKHFPLGGGGDGDAAGTLLGFEDEAGKCWRFRYSYWNSSQSYVLTKGWSRYVKEKRLDAGDVVFFERHRAEPDRLFIGWRRRGAPSVVAGALCYYEQGYHQAQDSRGRGHGAWRGGLPTLPAPPGATQQQQGATDGSRRLVRLFGVNLECQHGNPSSSQTTPSEWSAQQQLQQQGYGHHFDYSAHQSHSSNHHTHHSFNLEMNFPQGVNQTEMGNGLI